MTQTTSNGTTTEGDGQDAQPYRDAKVEVLFDAETIAARNRELVEEVVAAKPEKLIVIAVLKGSFVFAADLIRAMHAAGLAPEVEFITLSSYRDARISSGQVTVLRDVESDVRGRDVLLVDDILEIRPHPRLRQGPARRTRCAPGDGLRAAGEGAQARGADRGGFRRLRMPGLFRRRLRHGRVRTRSGSCPSSATSPTRRREGAGGAAFFASAPCFSPPLHPHPEARAQRASKDGRLCPPGRASFEAGHFRMTLSSGGNPQNEYRRDRDNVVVFF